jgi:hypothetical protein
MRTLNYFTTSSVWLSLESYHNAGLSSEETKTVIERIPDPGSSTSYLRCEPSGLNGNWVVQTNLRSGLAINSLVARIYTQLEIALEKKTGNPRESYVFLAVEERS